MLDEVCVNKVLKIHRTAQQVVVNLNQSNGKRDRKCIRNMLACDEHDHPACVRYVARQAVVVVVVVVSRCARTTHTLRDGSCLWQRARCVQID